MDAAERANAAACELIDNRRFREAIAPAAEACRLAPDWSSAWFNYAVALKHGHRWADCLEACERVLALQDGENTGMHWNAGIAATALGNWPRARAAWSAVGVRVPDGEGPLEMEIGLAGVRVSPEEYPEVVFGKRLDPCRARILSVPLPESNRRYGDVVLHDGEPRGKRRVGEGTCSVFDELMLLQPSSYGTWTAEMTCSSPAERDAIAALFDNVDGAFEDWTDNLEVMCVQCSLGEPHDHDDRQVAWSVERRFAIALPDEHELARLPARGVRSLIRVL